VYGRIFGSPSILLSLCYFNLTRALVVSSCEEERIVQQRLFGAGVVLIFWDSAEVDYIFRTFNSNFADCDGIKNFATPKEFEITLVFLVFFCHVPSNHESY